jgi:hypothetical protein
MQQGGLIKKEVGERLIYFSGDGISFFKGCHIGMTSQLKKNIFLT